MAGDPSGPDPTRVHTIADLARELGLLRARAAGGTHKTRVSLAELASRVGEPRSTVHTYVTGKYLPSAVVLDRIVIALGATPAEQREWSEAWYRVTAGQESGRRAEPVPRVGWANPVPRQLPPDITGFCGRRNELDRLDRMRPTGAAIGISVLTGGGGVGKSALAVHWAHRVASDFPDGQLWVDLRGFDSDAPLDPGVALAGFLRALGVPESDLPSDVAERAALYRTLLASRRVLVVLDNASSAEQVRPLLPGAASCLVLVTSRDRLTGLVARHGAHRIGLDVLPKPEALSLLRQLIGARVEAEAVAADELVSCCGALPLALRITAERAVARPTAKLRDLAEELANEQRRLDLLNADGDPRTAIRAVFSWSTRHLGELAYAALRRIGLHPVPHFDAPALAALLDTNLDQAQVALAELAAVHLINHDGSDRYRMHDLVHAWAAERAGHDDPEPDRAAALDRLADHHLRRAATAMDLLYPHEKQRRPAVEVTTAPRVFDDEAAARRWLEAEISTMIAVAGRRPNRAGALAAILRRHLETTSRYAEAQQLYAHALAAARETGDRALQASSLINLSAVHARTGRYDIATEQLQQAVQLCRDVGDTMELARALDGLGTVHGRTGRFVDAAAIFSETLVLCRRLGDRDGQSRALHNLGTVHGITGDYHTAESCFREALALCRALGDPLGEAYAVDNLGSVYCRISRYAEAVACHQQALALRREHGDRLGTAHALDNLGTAYRTMRHYRQALDCHQESLALRREIGDRGDEPHALNNLGVTHSLLEQAEQAIPYHHLALAQSRHAGNRYEQARAHDGLGVAHLALDDTDQAREHWLDALVLYDELGVPEATGVRAQLAALG